MSDWQRTLNLMPEWRECKEHKLRNMSMAGIIADRLEAMELLKGYEEVERERKSLVKKFRSLANTMHLRDETLNQAMKRLYDWGDAPLDGEWNGKKVCWIKTF